MEHSIFSIVIVLVGYIIGFFVSLFVLAKWGESHFDMNYDEPKTYVNHDDYDSNAQAALSFSIFWPLYFMIYFLKFLYDKGIILSKTFQKTFGESKN